MTLDQKQKQFWNRHAKRNKNPRDPNVSVLLGAFVSRSTQHASGSRGLLDSQESMFYVFFSLFIFAFYCVCLAEKCIL